MARLSKKYAQTDDYGVLPLIKRKGILRDRSYKVPERTGPAEDFVTEQTETAPRMKVGTKFEVTTAIPGLAQLEEGGVYVIMEVRPDTPAYVIGVDMDGEVSKVVVVHATDFDERVFGPVDDGAGEDYDSDDGADIAGEPEQTDEAKKVIFRKKQGKKGARVTADLMSDLGESMRVGTKKEFDEVIAKAKWPRPRRMQTKRSYDEFYSDRGTEVAEKHQIMTRGKVTSETYMINPDYLKEDCGCGVDEEMKFPRPGQKRKPGEPMSRAEYMAIDETAKVSERIQKLPEDATSKQRRSYQIAKRAIKTAWAMIEKKDFKKALAQAGVAEKHAKMASVYQLV